MANQLKVSARKAIAVILLGSAGTVLLFLTRRWTFQSSLIMGGAFGVMLGTIAVLYRYEIDILGPPNSGSSIKKWVAGLLGIGFIVATLVLVIALKP